MSRALLQAAFAAHATAIEEVRASLTDVILDAAGMLVRCVAAGNKVLWCGNGGSAADAQHLAAELVGRFAADRPGLAAIALTTDTSILTAVANDLGYERVFERQVQALGRHGDVLVAISTSGASRNMIAAVTQAERSGMSSIGLLGRDGGAMRELCDLSIVVPATDTARIQEAHILIGHVLCAVVEQSLRQGG